MRAYKATSKLEGPVAAMSGPLAPVPADDFVLPVPKMYTEDPEEARRSVDSARSQHFYDERNPSSPKKPLRSVWRHTIGIILLLATVVLWTASNFLASVCLMRAGMGGSVLMVLE